MATQEMVAHWESIGALDPECHMCREEFYERVPQPEHLPFMPSHKASSRCRSGKRAHCTCDTCF